MKGQRTAVTSAIVVLFALVSGGQAQLDEVVPSIADGNHIQIPTVFRQHLDSFLAEAGRPGIVDESDRKASGGAAQCTRGLSVNLGQALPRANVHTS